MLNFVKGEPRWGSPIFLAFDLGTRAGWACAHRDGAIRSGCFDFRNGPRDGEGRRFLKFRIALINFRKGPEDPSTPVRVFYEDVMFGGGGAQTQLAAQVFGGWKAILQSWCETHGYPYQGVHVGTWKKYIVGNGKAQKADVKVAVKALGHDPKSEDEADALGILYYGLGVEKNERVMACAQESD